MDVNRAEGHSGRVLAAAAVRALGRRGGWFGALGLQLPPGSHFPAMNTHTQLSVFPCVLWGTGSVTMAPMTRFT